MSDWYGALVRGDLVLDSVPMMLHKERINSTKSFKTREVFQTAS